MPWTLRPFANWKVSIFSRDNACNHIVLTVVDACACDGWWTRIVWGAMVRDATACTGSVDDLLLVNVLLVNKEYLQILWNFVTIVSVYFCLSRSEHERSDRTNVDSKTWETSVELKSQVIIYCSYLRYVKVRQTYRDWYCVRMQLWYISSVQ